MARTHHERNRDPNEQGTYPGTFPADRDIAWMVMHSTAHL
jgi:hypothetical protein